MQFTKAEEYGILGVLYLAERNDATVTPLSEISEARAIPEKFLAKIFQSLSRAGIVRSHRGVRGGFTLAKGPADISVKEILEAIQGPYHLIKCIKDNAICEKTDFCALRELLRAAEDRLVSVFEEHSLADLLSWEKNKAATI
ncbi:MAG TPA: Rrf2 family transcriptional regulator [candidate division Zixibacteria bacterium]|nr:Rrf2 family transcriptional regulator [candidate division Zixibacteria bacterium]MDD4918139.1 Rrf2 family transcriptional regulator [candidate division Zixibacteria bacterium]MDM7972082.1 Rrf2 family transcriptional regulator [candidate division Zixibacteria bacterium]HOD66148.1 Rrf2 family transcriptional regulator [candidate division Zixibacteria bacterium]HPM37343.1 Rrf2 family transcriptional regulator [candidate division Zixibacteria bacterium]